MNDEFYEKFPSFNECSKENKRQRKLAIDYKEFLRTSQSIINVKNKNGKSKIPVSKSDAQQIDDVFSVEERNRKVETESREKRINYQKVLLQQIEESKIKKKIQKEREQENEKVLEERLEKQIQNMNIQNNNDPFQNRVVERISFSENDKYRYHQPKQNNNVYRYFSKSSMSLFNYKDRYFNDLDVSKGSQNGNFFTNCTQCHKKLEILCSECKYHKDLNDSLNLDKIENSSNLLARMPKFRENYAPYTFDSSTRFQKYASNDSSSYDYLKLYNELKKNKNLEKEKNKYEPHSKKEPNIEELVGSNPQQYTVITGYAKSFLDRN